MMLCNMIHNVLHNMLRAKNAPPHFPLPWSRLASLQCQFIQQLLGLLALIIREGHATFRAGLICGRCRAVGGTQRRSAGPAAEAQSFLDGYLVYQANILCATYAGPCRLRCRLHPAPKQQTAGESFHKCSWFQNLPACLPVIASVKLTKNYATKWTLLNQVTEKSEVKQKHETSKWLKHTYISESTILPLPPCPINLATAMELLPIPVLGGATEVGCTSSTSGCGVMGGACNCMPLWQKLSRGARNKQGMLYDGQQQCWSGAGRSMSQLSDDNSADDWKAHVANEWSYITCYVTC
jgi:hypothetical protein